MSAGPCKFNEHPGLFKRGANGKERRLDDLEPLERLYTRSTAAGVIKKWEGAALLRALGWGATCLTVGGLLVVRPLDGLEKRFGVLGRCPGLHVDIGPAAVEVGDDEVHLLELGRRERAGVGREDDMPLVRLLEAPGLLVSEEDLGLVDVPRAVVDDPLPDVRRLVHGVHPEGAVRGVQTEEPGPVEGRPLGLLRVPDHDREDRHALAAVLRGERVADLDERNGLGRGLAEGGAGDGTEKADSGGQSDEKQGGKNADRAAYECLERCHGVLLLAHMRVSIVLGYFYFITQICFRQKALKKRVGVLH